MVTQVYVKVVLELPKFKRSVDPTATPSFHPIERENVVANGNIFVFPINLVAHFETFCVDI